MDQDQDRRRGFWSALPFRAWRIYARFVRMLLTLISGTVLIGLGVLFVNYVVLSTPKGQAYRNLDTSVPACQDGLAHGWTVLADIGRETLRAGTQMDDDGWADPSDVETDAIARDPKWKTLLRCSLQRHIVPAMTPGGKPIDYTLGFLEFQENGEPYALLSRDANADKRIDSAMIQHAMESEMHAKHMDASAVHPVITQLDVLKRHLATGSNFVVVFIHGWRHDAQIGDQNVADLRLYAAHAARFIAQRCPTEPTICDMKVTAIYVGWRGARVDERGLRDYFGETVGGFAGNVSAAATLFDRKPVAETIAPSAISALRTIETELAAGPGPNKMITFGHSLGGDMLATGLKDDLLKSVDRHTFGAVVAPVLGNLVVLINPAAEASKWTAIQREVWTRIAVNTNVDTPPAAVARDNGFFPPTQRPVIVSVTAALAFPAGGLRGGDCAWIGLTIDDKFKAARERIRASLRATDQMFDSGVDYDWATHDLFPTFKFDFRPFAAYLEHIAARIEGRQPEGESCATFPSPSVYAGLKSLPVRVLSLIMATFPFQNSSVEESHTIGNLDPPRPAAGVLADALPSAAPFGTTHELLGLHKPGSEKHNPYATLADAAIDCPVSRDWLTRARERRKDQYGMFWDSEDLAPPAAGATGQGAPTARFLHGLQLSGIAPITRANDPFWNLRAFDNALSRHDGYRLTSFICAMDQLVLDEITSDRVALRRTVSEARQPGTATAR